MKLTDNCMQQDSATTLVQPKILLFTASFGEGHNAAARGMRMALEAREHMNLSLSAESRLIDVPFEVYPKLTSLLRKLYLQAIHHAPNLWIKAYNGLDANVFFMRYWHKLAPLRDKVEQEIREFHPDAVVSTFPFYNQIIDQIFREEDPPFLRFTVVTDSIRVNTAWARGKSDYYIVANQPTLQAVQALGISPAKIVDLGFPVSLQFANCQIERGKPPPWQIFYLPGGAWKKIEDNIKMLVALPKVFLTVCAGKDPKLYRRLKSLKESFPIPFKIEGWVDDMPERLLAQHLVIGKAGGAIVQESIAAGCPMIISQVIPGHEEGNILLIQRQGIGAVADSTEALKTVMIRMMQGEAALWRTWKSHLLFLQRPLAAETIVRFILGRVAVGRTPVRLRENDHCCRGL